MNEEEEYDWWDLKVHKGRVRVLRSNVPSLCLWGTILVNTGAPCLTGIQQLRSVVSLTFHLVGLSLGLAGSAVTLG